MHVLAQAALVALSGDVSPLPGESDLHLVHVLRRAVCRALFHCLLLLKARPKALGSSIHRLARQCCARRGSNISSNGVCGETLKVFHSCIDIEAMPIQPCPTKASRCLQPRCWALCLSRRCGEVPRWQTRTCLDSSQPRWRRSPLIRPRDHTPRPSQSRRQICADLSPMLEAEG